MNADANPNRSPADYAPLPASIARLLEDHRRLEAVMGVFDRHVHDGTLHQHQVLDLLSCLTDYIAEYPEQVHHPREDQITDRLVDKGLTPGERVLIELTVSQHAELSALTQRIAEDVDRILAGRAEADISFHADVGQYLELQRQHMRREEQQLFPLAARMLTSEDWREIEAEIARSTGPQEEARDERYRSLFDLVGEGGRFSLDGQN